MPRQPIVALLPVVLLLGFPVNRFEMENCPQ
jgi:hypothetical protein